MDAHMCLCGTTLESRTHIVGEREACKEERDVLRVGDDEIRRM